MALLTLTIKYWRPLAVLLVLVLTWLSGFHAGDAQRERVWVARWSAHAAKDAEALAQATTAARERERQWVAAFDVSAEMYQERVNEVEKRRASLMRDIAAGRLRLPATPASVPAAAAHPADAGAGQEAGQSDLVAGAVTERLAECDEAVIERNLAVELLRLERGPAR